MATTVREIMNPETLTFPPEETAKNAVKGLLAAGVSGAAIVDAKNRPLGVLSLRDILTHRTVLRVDECMSAPALVIEAEAPIREAARLLAETGFHRLVVVQSDGRIAGIVASTDVIRGLLGLPPLWPTIFPPMDRRSHRTWSDDLPLHLDRVDSAPAGPGVLALIHGAADQPDRVVWAEVSTNLRGRLVGILAEPASLPPAVASFLSRGHLRFRVAPTHTQDEQRRVLKELIEA